MYKEFEWKYKKRIFKEYYQDDVREGGREDEIEQESFSEIDLLLNVQLSRRFATQVQRVEEERNTSIDMDCSDIETVREYVCLNKAILKEISESKRQDENDTNDMSKQFVNNIIQKYREKRSYLTPEELEGLSNFPELEAVIEEINTYFINYGEKKPAPYKLYEKLCSCVDKKYTQKRQLVKSLSKIYKYIPKKYITCQMTILGNEYNSHVDAASDEVCRVMVNSVNEYLSVSEVIEDEEMTRGRQGTGMLQHFMDNIELMRTAIRQQENNMNVFGRYREEREKDRGCFGVLSYENKMYYSLSGVFDIDRSNIDKELMKSVGYDETSQREKSLYEKVERVCQPIMQDATWAKFNRKVERYDENSTERYPSALQSVQEAMYSDMEAKEIRGHFSCCERKMFAYISSDISDEGYIFARLKPCMKCKPAIRKFMEKRKKISVYYLDDNRKIKLLDNKELG